MKVGKLLLEEKGRHRLSDIAIRLEVDVRTLRNWRERAKQALSPRLGRPRHSVELRGRALWLVARELRAQGYPGWRPIKAALPELPTRLIQEHVRAIKTRRRCKLRRRSERQRIRATVHVHNAVWAQDGTHLGRASSRPIEAQVIRDRATRKTIAWTAGPPATHQEVLALLEISKQDRGLPLVWMTDNGSIYQHGETQRYLTEERVIHLRSLPRTPQHNSGVEIAMREHKTLAGLGRGVRIDSVESAAGAMLASTRALNGNRLRATLGLKTADEIDDRTNVHYTESIRARFYSACCNRIQAAVMNASSARGRRSAEREAILRTMEDFGLLKREQGGRPITRKAEVFL